jgi:thermolabile hemolysin
MSFFRWYIALRKSVLTLIVSCLSLIMVLLTSPSNSLGKVNEIIIFGDSLSDVGNVYNITKGIYPPNPPYFQGRYSNGLVWVEYIASQLAVNSKQTTNFAYGGATTVKVGSYGIPGLLGQVSNFQSAQSQVQSQANSNALYIIWAGANDYLYGATNTTMPAENLAMAIQSLSQIGAKKILVANLPDLGNLPHTRNSSNSSILTASTNSHNLSLSKSLDVLRKKFGSNTEIIELDANSLYKEAIFNPAKFGFTNVQEACLNNLTSCDNPDKFLFWDGIHPTTAGHRILAEAALSKLENQMCFR